MKRVLDNMFRILLAGETYSTEVVLGWFLFNWGVWILLPFSNFVSPVIAWDGAFPSLVFSITAITVATAAIVGASLDDYFMRRLASFVAGVLWLAVGSSMLLTNQHDHVVVLYLFLSAAAFWLHVRVRFRWSVI